MGVRDLVRDRPDLIVREAGEAGEAIADVWKSADREAVNADKTAVVAIRGDWPGVLLLVHSSELDRIAGGPHAG